MNHSALKTNNVDVVVVGAGVAGLAATYTLLNQGKKVITLEASERVGGRAWTDCETFGVPFDRGARYLHDDSANPWFKYSLNHGFELYTESEQLNILGKGGEAVSHEARNEFLSSYERANVAIKEAGKRGEDVSIGSVLQREGVWDQYVFDMLGLWTFGAEANRLSTLDYYRSTDHGQDWLCRQGFGKVVHHFGQGIPVHLNTPVKRIRWDDCEIIVETTNGNIHASKVILTVSVGVLTSEKIIFDPPLPTWKVKAIEQIPMITCNHIALMFNEDVFGLGPDNNVITELGYRASYVTNVSNSNLVLVWVGGSVARKIENEGSIKAVEFALDEISDLLGTSVQRKFIKGFSTNWGQDPWSCGAYAMAKPGSHHLREQLSHSIEQRLFFAGEACHSVFVASCHGAFMSGVNTALQVSALLDKE